MSIFTEDSLTFFQDLKANNSRDWFQANKTRYEAGIKKPAAFFCAEICARMQEWTGMPHQSKIFRINRDLRFSKDKSPYNTHLHIAFTAPHGPASPPAWMFGLSTDYLTIGCGVMAFAKGELDRYRQRVAGRGGIELEDQLSQLQSQGYRLSDADLKRVPAPYEKDHARADLLRHKGICLWYDFPNPELALSDDLVARCMDAFRPVLPIHNWLAEV